MRANDEHSGLSFSLGGIILIALSIGASASLLDALLYARHGEPIALTSADGFPRLEDGDFVRVTGRLDYESALVASKAVGDDYVLAPLVGFRDQLWVSIKNGTLPSIEPKEMTFVGRIEAKDGSQWTIGDARDIDLAYQARQVLAVPVSDKALVLRDGVRPGDDLTAFTWITGVLGALILLVYLRALVSAVAGLVRSGDRTIAAVGS